MSADQSRTDQSPTAPSRSGQADSGEKELTILVYSDDRATRENIRLALGRKVATDLPTIRVVECATQAAVVTSMDAGGVDLAIFDGEAVPVGGLGLCREVKDEIYNCPPVLVMIMREQDVWLATWSRADGAVAHPVDPVRLPNAVADLLRRSRAHAVSG